MFTAAAKRFAVLRLLDERGFTRQEAERWVELEDEQHTIELDVSLREKFKKTETMFDEVKS